MNVAVILAGGSGTRLGSGLPKQFLKVAGKKIIEHTIDVFENNSLIDEIAVVSKEEYISEVEAIVVSNQYSKVKKILVGGKERYHSSLSAIEAYTNDDDILLFHDAVRPLVNNRIINDCIYAMNCYNAVDVAINATDTIIEVNSENCIENIPDRSKLRNGQTPQCFRRKTIKKAYEYALKDPNFITTDDCGVVRKYLREEPVGVVRGENFNMKVTHVEDLFLLDKLFQLKSIQEDENKLNERTIKKLSGKILVVFGGSYGIGEEIVKMARDCGAIVYPFSRSLNGVDVREPESICRELERVYREHGHIDYIVCTAGLLQKEPFSTMSYDDIRKGIEINLIGVVNVAKESYPYLSLSHGAILFYTSSSYTRGRMLYSIYSSTKAAIVNFTQALSEEWFCDKIRVNCINPERCDTPMRRSNFGIEPAGSLLTPDKVAIASLNTLVSKFTGEVIDVKIKKDTL